MGDYQELFKILLDAVESSKQASSHTDTPDVTVDPYHIPVGISNRHAHLSQDDLDVLFGQGYVLTPMKDLGQPGQYACKEMITLCGPKGAIEKVRILGPTRKESQIELLVGDCFKLGIKPVLRMSGDLNGSPGLTVVGPKGSVQLEKGAIIAQRHIHMHTDDAKRFGVHDGQIVKIEVEGLRGGILNNVAIRANDQSALECHIDIEEGNGLQANSKSKINIIS